MFLLLILVIICAVFIRGGRKTLKPLFHLLAVLLLMPSFLFACACLVLQSAIARGTLFGFFDAIFSFVVAMYPWETTVMLVCFVILLAAGFGVRWQCTAAGVVVALAFASAGIMHWVAGLPNDPSQWWFFVPGLLSVLISGWLFVQGQSSGHSRFASAHPGQVLGKMEPNDTPLLTRSSNSLRENPDEARYSSHPTPVCHASNSEFSSSFGHPL